MRKIIFGFLIFLLFSGCQSTKAKSPFKLSGFWPSKEAKQKTVSDMGTGLLEAPLPMKGKIDTETEINLQLGDKLRVVVEDQKELSGEYSIDEDGYIELPIVGKVYVLGFSPLEVEDILIQELKRYIRNPVVSITVTDSYYKKVIAFGAFGGFGPEKQMDFYTLNKPTRLLDLLAAFGGPKADADIRNISIVHSDGSKDIVNLNRIIMHGELDRNIPLRGGDIVSIFSAKSGENNILVLGAVTNPGVYPVSPDMTAIKALALAKSFTKDALVEETFVIRTKVENPYLLKVNIKRVLLKGESARDILLKKGDIVFVPDNPVTNYNRVLSRIRPTLGILNDITGLVIDTDAISQAFDRGFGEVDDTSATGEVSTADIQRTAERAANDEARRSLSSSSSQ